MAAKTEQRIKDVLPEGSVSEHTHLVLCNTIFSKEKWVKKFEIEEWLTDFHPADVLLRRRQRAAGQAGGKYGVPRGCERPVSRFLW